MSIKSILDAEREKYPDLKEVPDDFLIPMVARWHPELLKGTPDEKRVAPAPKIYRTPQLYEEEHPIQPFNEFADAFHAMRKDKKAGLEAELVKRPDKGGTKDQLDKQYIESVKGREGDFDATPFITGFNSGMLTIQRAMGQTAEFGFATTGEALKFYLGGEGFDTEAKFWKDVVESSQETKEAYQFIQRVDRGSEIATFIGELVPMALPSLVAMPLGLPAVIAAGVMQSYAQVRVGAEDDYRKQSDDHNLNTPDDEIDFMAHWEGMFAAASTGIITSVFTKFGLGGLESNLLGAKSKAFREGIAHVMKHTVGEFSEEGIDSVVHATTEKLIRSPELSLDDILRGALMEAVGGALIGGSLTGASVMDTNVSAAEFITKLADHFKVSEKFVRTQMDVMDRADRSRDQTPRTVAEANEDAVKEPVFEIVDETGKVTAIDPPLVTEETPEQEAASKKIIEEEKKKKPKSDDPLDDLPEESEVIIEGNDVEVHAPPVVEEQEVVEEEESEPEGELIAESEEVTPPVVEEAKGLTYKERGQIANDILDQKVTVPPEDVPPTDTVPARLTSPKDYHERQSVGLGMSIDELSDGQVASIIRSRIAGVLNYDEKLGAVGRLPETIEEQREFLRTEIRELEQDLREKEGRYYTGTGTKGTQTKHRKGVVKAIEQGKKISESAVSEYPDLKKEADEKGLIIPDSEIEAEAQAYRDEPVPLDDVASISIHGWRTYKKLTTDRGKRNRVLTIAGGLPADPAKRNLAITELEKLYGPIEYLGENPFEKTEIVEQKKRIPKLKQMQNQGDLLGDLEEDLTLTGERTTDGDRLSAEKEAVEKSKQDAKEFQDKNQMALPGTEETKPKVKKGKSKGKVGRSGNGNLRIIRDHPTGEWDILLQIQATGSIRGKGEAKKRGLQLDEYDGYDQVVGVGKMLISKDGMAPDEVVQMLRDAGWDIDSTSQLWEAIGNAVTVRRHAKDAPPDFINDEHRLDSMLHEGVGKTKGLKSDVRTQASNLQPGESFKLDGKDVVVLAVSPNGDVNLAIEGTGDYMAPADSWIHPDKGTYKKLPKEETLSWEEESDAYQLTQDEVNRPETVAKTADDATQLATEGISDKAKHEVKGSKAKKKKLTRIEENINLVQKALSRYRNINDQGEAESVALAALMKADESYNPEKGVKFSTYVNKAIDNALKNLFKKQVKEQQNTVSIEEQTGESQTIGDTLQSDKASSPEVLTAKQEVNRLIQQIEETLTEEEHEMWQYMKKQNNRGWQARYAAVKGVSPSTVSKRKKALEDKMEGYLRETGGIEELMAEMEKSGKGLAYFSQESVEGETEQEQANEPDPDEEPPVESLFPEVEANWQSARGVYLTLKIYGKRLIEKLKAGARHFEHIPEDEFGEANERLRQMEEIPRVAAQIAFQLVNYNVHGLSDNEKNIFGRMVILPDLIEDHRGRDEAGQTIAEDAVVLHFGYKSVAEMEADLKHFQKNASDAVWTAVKRRTRMINKIRDDLISHGLLPEKVRDHKQYFHRQVMQYIALEVAGDDAATAAARIKSSSSGATSLVSRQAWQKARTGSNKDFNTSYIQAESAYLQSALAQIESTVQLAKLKETYDIKQDLKKEAKESNKALMNERIPPVIETQPDMLNGAGKTTITHWYTPYAAAHAKLNRQIAQGVLDGWLTAPNNGFAVMLDDLGDAYAEFKMELAEAQAAELPFEEYPKWEFDHPQYWHFLNALLENQSPGASLAGAIYKNLEQRETLIRETLGDDYLKWKMTVDPRLIPDTHTIWQMEEGNHYWHQMSVTDKVIDKLLKGEMQLKESDLKKVMVVGAPKDQWIIPKPVAAELKEFKQWSHDDKFALSIFAKVWSGWKRWRLFNPMSVVQYQINNLFGDFDAVTAFDPRIWKEEGLEAVKFIRKWQKDIKAGKPLDPEVKELLEKRVLSGTERLGELSRISDVDLFNAMSPNQSESFIKKMLNFYPDLMKNMNDLREMPLRVAAYRYSKKLMAKGEKLYGASNRKAMDDIHDVSDKAAKFATELLGDYGGLSQTGQYLRSRIIPFWSWMEINAPRYYRMMKNIPYETHRGTEFDGQLGWAITKASGAAAAGFAVRAGSFYAITSIWNLLVSQLYDEPEEVRRISQDRKQHHLLLPPILPGGAVGSLRFQGALSDVGNWIKTEEIPHDIGDVYNGRQNILSKVLEVSSRPFQRAYESANPYFFKTMSETLAGYSFWPDPMNPRPIRDRARHVAKFIALENVYDVVADIAGKPKRPGRGLPTFLFDRIGYITDPGEKSYYVTRGLVRRFQKDQGEEMISFSPTDKSTAIYFHKQALRMGDERAAKEWMKEYRELGGTTRGIRRSVELAKPTQGLNSRERRAFLNTLTGTERAIMDSADNWYKRVYKNK